jgi:hypothetical protein
MDGERAYHLITYPFLLALAKSILVDSMQSFSNFQVRFRRVKLINEFKDKGILGI